MPGLRFDSRVLSTAASSSDRGVQVEPADGYDTAIHRLRVFGIYAERHHRAAAPAHLHSHALPLGLVMPAGFLLGLSQHALVPIRFVAAARRLSIVPGFIPLRMN